MTDIYPSKIFINGELDREIFIFSPDLVVLFEEGKEKSYQTYYDPSEDEYLPTSIDNLETDHLEYLLEMFSSCADKEMLELYLEELLLQGVKTY